MHLKEISIMHKFPAVPSLLVALLASTAFADSTTYTPIATGFTLPNAQQAVTAGSADTATYAATAGSTGYATNAGTATNANFATAAGSAKTATNATNAVNATNADTADSASYADNAGVAQQAAGLTAGKTCAAGTALSVTKGVLGCVSSVTSITGNLNGSQIVGNITNVGSITTSGNIVSSNGYVYGVTGLFTDNAVFSNSYAGRWGGSNAVFNGTADSATSANYATTAGSTNYAASSVVGILYQHSAGDGASYYCGTGYYLKFYDTNVDSTNNAFFYECIQNGH
jgi:hypothetical protein